MEWFDNFTANFSAELLASFIVACIAFLFRGPIGNFFRKVIQPKPELDLYFGNNGKVLEVAPSTSADDYDISFTLSIQNIGEVSLPPKQGYVYFFTPISATMFEGHYIRTDSQYHRHRLEIEDLVMPGFTDLSNSTVRFRITNPVSREIKIPYYIQTPFGVFPDSVLISSIRESTYVAEGSGNLIVRLLDRK